MSLKNLSLGMDCDASEFERVIDTFPEYFKKIDSRYVLIIEPSRELKRFCEKEFEIQQIASVEDYDLYVRKAAEHLADNMNHDDKEMILKNPDYIKHHFGFGMYIRNEYIHGRNLQSQVKMGVFRMADDISADIFHDLVDVLREDEIKCISHLELTVRSINCLTRSGIDSIRKLCNLSSDELKKIRNMGQKSYGEILNVMKSQGLSLRDGVPLTDLKSEDKAD